jgi:hypothetical protein
MGIGLVTTAIAENQGGVVSLRRVARHEKTQDRITEEAQFKPTSELHRSRYGRWL